MARTLKPVKPAVLSIVWISLLFSILIYGVIAYIYASSPDNEPTSMEPERLQMMIILFTAFAIGEVFLSLWFRLDFRKRLERGQFVELEDPSPLYYQACITSWALINSIAIYGLVLVFLSLNFVYFLAFAGPAFILMLAFMPQLKSIQEIAKRVRNKKGFDTPQQAE